MSEITLPNQYEAQNAENIWTWDNSIKSQDRSKNLIKKPVIKNKISFVVSMILLVWVIYFVIDRIQFLSVAAHTTWVVESVTASNDRCSERRNKRTYHYDCTRFHAVIWFDTLPPPPIVHSNFNLSAGSVRWHDQPLSLASRYESEITKVTYDPKNISRVYEDTLFGVWWTPITAFFAQIITLFGAFSEKKKRDD